MRAVAGSLGSLRHDLLGRDFHVVSPANFGKQVDKCGAPVQRVASQLGSLVVPRKRVVIVMEAFAVGEGCYREVLGGAYIPAKEVSKICLNQMKVDAI